MNDSPQPDDAQASFTAIAQEPEFQDLVKRKKSLSIVLTVLIFGVYFGFIGLMAFAPTVLSQSVGSATLGIPIGIGVIVFAWILTGIYVRWANGAYDAMVARVKSKR